MGRDGFASQTLSPDFIDSPTPAARRGFLAEEDEAEEAADEFGEASVAGSEASLESLPSFGDEDELGDGLTAFDELFEDDEDDAPWPPLAPTAPRAAPRAALQTPPPSAHAAETAPRFEEDTFTPTRRERERERGCFP